MCSCDIWGISRLWSGLSYQFHCLSLHAQQPHTHIYPSIYCPTRLYLVQSWVTHSYFLQTHTNTFLISLSLSLWWCWLSDKRLFASPPLPFSFPLHSSHISQVTLSSVPHTYTHTLNHGWTCLISTPLLCITSHSLHSHCIDPACRHT